MGNTVHRRPILTLNTSGAWGEHENCDDTTTEIENSPESHIENFPSPNALGKYEVGLEMVLEMYRLTRLLYLLNTTDNKLVGIFMPQSTSRYARQKERPPFPS
jgi:hypothetical protein